jgi:signal transduction histidine kinase
MNILNPFLNTCIIEKQIIDMAYYAHVISVFFAFFIIFLILAKGKKNFISRIFFSFLVVFVLWLIGNLITWVVNDYYLVYTTWSFLVYFEVTLFVLAFYFTSVFVNQKDFSFWGKALLFLITLPPLILALMQKTVNGFDQAFCEAYNNVFLENYKITLEILILALIFRQLILPFVKKITTYTRKSSIFVIGAMFLFLAVFSLTEFLAGSSGNYEIQFYYLFLAPIFLISIIYSIFNLNIFNLRTVSTYFFVFGFLVLAGSQLLFVSNNTDRFLTFLTFFLSVLFSIFLFRNLKRESDQRVYIEKLNSDLKRTIDQRESLVHLVTHKVKGSFTRSKYIFAGILDGSFGETNEEIKKMAQAGFDSDNAGVKTVDLVLNASNLQKGTVKFDFKKIDFKNLINQILSEKAEIIKEKKLELEIDIPEDDFFVKGDIFWLREAILNLVDNSIKYTLAGKISLGLKKNENKMLFWIKDTGIGITGEDKKNLFTEGGRGKDSVRVNVDSTGYGLFSTKLVINDHQGKVWAESEGLNKGSAFFVELNLV